MANMAQAIRMALHYGEQNLGLEHIFGEDVGPPLGGVFTCTQGLTTTWNSPLDERGIGGLRRGVHQWLCLSRHHDRTEQHARYAS